jgi:hypothetical protein
VPVAEPEIDAGRVQCWQTDWNMTERVRAVDEHGRVRTRALDLCGERLDRLDFAAAVRSLRAREI